MYQQQKNFIILVTLLTLTSCTHNNQKGLNLNIRTPNFFIKIITDSKRYKLGESIDIEVTSSKIGFVNILLINPKSKVTKLNSTQIKEEFRSYLKADTIGEYRLIAIYTKQKTDMKPKDFRLKNLGDKDVYDIYKFKITN